jgi:hypothetical protein
MPQPQQVKPKSIPEKVVVSKNVIVIHPSPNVDINRVNPFHVFNLGVPKQGYGYFGLVGRPNDLNPARVMMAASHMLFERIAVSYLGGGALESFSIWRSVVPCEQTIGYDAYPHCERSAKVRNRKLDLLPLDFCIQSGQWKGLNREATAFSILHHLNLGMSRFCALISSHSAYSRGLSGNQEVVRLFFENCKRLRSRVSSIFCLNLHYVGLSFYGQQRSNADPDPDQANPSQNSVNPDSSLVPTILGWGRDDPYIGWNVLLIYGIELPAVLLLYRRLRDWRGWLLALLSLLCGLRLGISLHREDVDKDRENKHLLEHSSKIVQQKLLTLSNYRYTVLIRG